MYYPVVVSILISLLSLTFLRGRLGFLFVFTSCIVGIFFLYQYCISSVDLLSTHTSNTFFPKIGEIDIFTFASRSPAKNIEIASVLFLLLLVLGVFSFSSFLISRDDLLDELDISKITLILLSLLFLIFAADMFQLIMSWLFISAVLYFAINSKEHDASEIDNVIYTSSLLVISDALFIVGIIAITYADFSSRNEITDFLEWDLVWLMNPLGSIFVIFAVIFKSESVSLNSWINTILNSGKSVIQVYIYSVYTCLAGAIILLHFDSYILESSFVSKLAIIIFTFSMSVNFIKCLFDINLNRIIVYFSLANFNYIFVSFFLGYNEFFIYLIVIQSALSTISFVGSEFLFRMVETNDIREIIFDKSDKSIMILSVIGFIFIPQLFFYLLTDFDINKMMFFSSDFIGSIIFVLHLLLCFFVSLRLLMVLLLYNNKNELILFYDFKRIFLYFSSISISCLIILLFQVSLLNNFVAFSGGQYLFNIMYILYFILFMMLIYLIINSNKQFYGNLHCNYPNVFLTLQKNVYFSLIFYPFYLLFFYVKSLIISIYLSIFDNHIISSFLSRIAYFIDNNFIRLQKCTLYSKLIIILGFILFFIFAYVVNSFDLLRQL